MLAQVPSATPVIERTQAWQVPTQDVLQQMPATQLPVAHAAFEVHEVPPLSLAVVVPVSLPIVPSLTLLLPPSLLLLAASPPAVMRLRS